jgi:hypothetical protein
MTSPSASHRERTLWRAACVAVALVTVATVPLRWQCEGADEIEYLSLARSLAHGDGYTIDGQPHVLYPPLFPLLLAAVNRVAGVGAWRILYSVNAAAGVAGLILLASWLRRNYGRAGRWAAWFAVTAYYPWSFSTRFLLSEPLFFLLSALALIAADQLRRGRRPAAAGVVLLVLLCAFTRAGALALVAGLALALTIGAVRSRRWALLGTAVTATVLAVAFFGFWEWRAASLRPDAAESYGRWARTLAGATGNEGSLVGRNAGEGVEGPTTLPQRVALEGLKLGQYVASVVRTPDAFKPLAVLIFLLVLWGAFHELRREPDSPCAWYALATLGMVAMTSWVSSYHRYFHPLTPVWWWLLFRGARAWTEGGTWSRARGALLAAGGVLGVVWAIGKSSWDAPGPEGLYLVAVGGVAVAFYLLLILVGIRMVWVQASVRIDGRAVLVMLLALLLHNAVLVDKRFRLVRSDAALRQRGLAGLLDVAERVRVGTPADAAGTASVPRLVSLAADRDMVPPRYKDGQLHLEGLDFVVLMGSRVDIPGFRVADENTLYGAAEPLLESSRLHVHARSGDAAFLRVVSRASN